jgi:hypothetical protein
MAERTDPGLIVVYPPLLAGKQIWRTGVTTGAVKAAAACQAQPKDGASATITVQSLAIDEERQQVVCNNKSDRDVV